MPQKVETYQTWGEQPKDDSSFRILNLGDWQNKESGGLEMEKFSEIEILKPKSLIFLENIKYHFF